MYFVHAKCSRCEGENFHQVSPKPRHYAAERLIGTRANSAAWIWHSVCNEPVAWACNGNRKFFRGHLVENTLLRPNMAQKASRQIRRSNRPVLEHLEDRLTPTAYQLIYSAAVAQATDNYLDSYYQNLLGHEPDSQGLAYWSGQIQSGVSAATVAAGIYNSTEHHTDQVNWMFNKLLGRDAGTDTIAFFDGQLQAGATEAQVMTTIVQSSEFTHGDTSSATFVNNLYQKVLGRSPDAGAAGWIAALSSGTSRASVAQSFLLSDEALTDVVDTYYENFLNREPASAEAAFWVTSMHNSQTPYESVALSILTSPEFMTLSSSTPQAPMPPLF